MTAVLAARDTIHAVPTNTATPVPTAVHGARANAAAPNTSASNASNIAAQSILKNTVIQRHPGAHFCAAGMMGTALPRGSIVAVIVAAPPIAMAGSAGIAPVTVQRSPDSYVEGYHEGCTSGAWGEKIEAEAYSQRAPGYRKGWLQGYDDCQDR